MNTNPLQDKLAAFSSVIVVIVTLSPQPPSKSGPRRGSRKENKCHRTVPKYRAAFLVRRTVSWAEAQCNKPPGMFRSPGATTTTSVTRSPSDESSQQRADPPLANPSVAPSLFLLGTYRRIATSPWPRFGVLSTTWHLRQMNRPIKEGIFAEGNCSREDPLSVISYHCCTCSVSSRRCGAMHASAT